MSRHKRPDRDMLSKKKIKVQKAMQEKAAPEDIKAKL